VKLLVSVVSASEARLALAGGADIIDVKDPREGALGAPSPRTLAEVVAAVDGAAPVSVALGDLPDLPHTAALAAGGAAACGVDYVKLGLRGVRGLDRAVALVTAVADALGARAAGVGVAGAGAVGAGAVGAGAVGAGAAGVHVQGVGPGVIAAAYADGTTADPPAFDPALLPELVARTGIEGALIDTLVKDGRGLYSLLSEATVADLVAATRAAGGSFGVAGQLRAGQLGRVDADIVGVRSAVCRGGDRGASLEAELVAAAVAELRGVAVSRA
jgi:(5-formylfuran-3-yl)methyl phosphate synthase